MERPDPRKKAILALWLAAACLGLAACGGIGLGEGSGMPDLTPPPPPDHNNEIFWGRVSGQVEFDQAFLHNEFMANSGPRSNPKAPTAGLVRDRTFYQRLEARLKGAKGKLEQKVGPDGAFDFGRVRFGAWKLEILAPDGILFATDIVVESKSKQMVMIRVMGHDLADVDADGDHRELLFQKEVSYKADQVEFVRVTPPAGDVRTRLPGGNLEIQGPEGYVKVIHPDGQVEYRYDPNNEFVDVDRDPTLPGRKKNRAENTREKGDRLMAALTGKGRSPVILDASLRTYGGDSADLAPGTLAHLMVTADACGGSPITGVEVLSVSQNGKNRRLSPLDDGSANDLVREWVGVQSSLDEKPGDGVYSLAIPLDGPNYAFLRANHLVARARNEEDRLSRPFSLHVYLSPPRSTGDQGAPLVSMVRGSRLVSTVPGQHHAEFVLGDLQNRTLSALLMGPEGFQRILFPDVRPGLLPGLILYATTPAPLVPGAPYTLVAADSAGGIYYTRLLPE